jgi:hypothetical protein
MLGARHSRGAIFLAQAQDARLESRAASTKKKGPAFAGPYAYAYATLKAVTLHGACSGWPR